MKPFYLIVPIFLAASSIALADDTGSTRTIKTDPAGTTVTTDMSHTDSVSKSGIAKSTEDEKTVVDPKGLMNKTSAKSHSERTEGPKGEFAASNTTTHGNGTVEKSSAKRTVSKNWTNKGKTTTTTLSKSVDPTGLGNKKTVEVAEQIETAPNRATTKTTTKKVDGDTVSEETKVTR